MTRKFFVGGNWKMNGDKKSIDGICAFLNQSGGEQICSCIVTSSIFPFIYPYFLYGVSNFICNCILRAITTTISAIQLSMHMTFKQVEM
ncbi:unnamed protein product [Haemonchus placei]|uniref:Triose-phosphate isomerase n=1 Tax=Haemonchus placei TaxID=6290 RepID=A0A0N4VXT1_HAEPC|nr:unnamed protein product [Haemonchus placei]